MRPCTTAGSWKGCWTRATPAMMCSPTALIGWPRSSPNSGPVVTTVGFIDAVGATIRQRKCASEPHQEPDTRIEHVFGAQQNAPGGRIVRTIGIVRARAKIGLQNLAYNLQHSPPGDAGNGSPRHEDGGVVCSVPTYPPGVGRLAELPGL